MTDRELLELAAKACGWTVVPRSHRDCGGCNVHTGGGATLVNWNPLTDDGDALRLAVALHLDVLVDMTVTTALTPLGGVFDEHHRGEAAAATRRAIVRAVAAIGKAMP